MTLVFIDFSKAFSSVNRKAMLHIIAAIKRMYKNLQTFVDITNGPTDIFSIPTGIFQGDTLAPYLFLAVIDYILHQSVDNISKKGLLLKGLLF